MQLKSIHKISSPERADKSINLPLWALYKDAGKEQADGFEKADMIGHKKAWKSVIKSYCIETLQ